MEKMPIPPVSLPTGGRSLASAWQRSLPVLTGAQVTLRELTRADAPALLAMMTTGEVARFISPPPTTVEGFERFVAWTIRERELGHFICFAVVPAGLTQPVGLFQVRRLEHGFASAEWGFALGSGFWGTGVFLESARLVLDFAFDVVGVHRLEARASIANGRGNGALRKLGAVAEGVLRRSFFCFGEYHDQVLWSVLAADWRVQRSEPRRQIH